MKRYQAGNIFVNKMISLACKKEHGNAVILTTDFT